MKLKKSFSPGTLRAEQHGARQRTCQRSPLPAMTTVTVWVPLAQRRAGEEQGHGWQPAWLLLAAAQPADAQHIGVSHTLCWTRVAPPPKGNPLAWLWPSPTTTKASAATTSAACAALHNLRRVQAAGFFLARIN